MDVPDVVLIFTVIIMMILYSLAGASPLIIHIRGFECVRMCVCQVFDLCRESTRMGGSTENLRVPRASELSIFVALEC